MLAGLCLVTASLGCAAGVAEAQGYSPDKPLGMSAQQRPDYLAHAGLEQRLGQPLPMQAQFTDETGRTGPLASWFEGKPVATARSRIEIDLPSNIFVERQQALILRLREIHFHRPNNARSEFNKLIICVQCPIMSTSGLWNECFRFRIIVAETKGHACKVR